MTKPTGPSNETVEKVWDRDGGACFRCGRKLHFHRRGYDWSLHHRAPRQSGGSRHNPWINLHSNGAIACGSGVTGCHWYIENHRREAEDAGWIVRRGIRIPAEISMWHQLYGPAIYLTDVGTVSTHPPQETLL